LFFCSIILLLKGIGRGGLALSLWLRFLAIFCGFYVATVLENIEIRESAIPPHSQKISSSGTKEQN
jgi:hypothetical protein